LTLRGNGVHPCLHAGHHPLFRGIEDSQALELKAWLGEARIQLEASYPKWVLDHVAKFLKDGTKSFGESEQALFVRTLIASATKTRDALAGIALDGVYAPSPDDDLGLKAMPEGLKSTLYQTAFVGGKGGLDKLNLNSTLYILCHGTPVAPVFDTDSGKFTAEKMAKMLQADGLRKNHRDIELLVCRAGQSVTSKAVADARLALLPKMEAAQQAGNRTELATLNQQSPRANNSTPASSPRRTRRSRWPRSSSFTSGSWSTSRSGSSATPVRSRNATTAARSIWTFGRWTRSC
jgi:hypothetical protein